MKPSGIGGRGYRSNGSYANLFEQRENLAFQRFDIGLDLFQRPLRFVAVKVAIERDLVTDPGFAFVDPRIGDVREDFALEVVFDLLSAGTFSVSRRSASGSGLPRVSVQMSAVSSRSLRRRAGEYGET